jgi:hypothetical protein
VRVALETYVQLARFGDDTANWQKRGAAWLPFLLPSLFDSSKLALTRSVVMAAMTAAVPAMVAIVR